MRKLLLCTLERASAACEHAVAQDIDYLPRPGRFHLQGPDCRQKKIDAALADLPNWLKQKTLNPNVSWTCGTWSSQKYQTCKSCTLARYCSPGCQRTDWRKTHRHQCPEVAKLGANQALNLAKDVMAFDGSFTEERCISKMSIKEAVGVVGQFNMLNFGAPEARSM